MKMDGNKKADGPPQTKVKMDGILSSNDSRPSTIILTRSFEKLKCGTFLTFKAILDWADYLR